jgi:autotransporter family porin
MEMKGIETQMNYRYANKMITLVFLFSIVFTVLSTVNTVSADQSIIYVSDLTGDDGWNGESSIWNDLTMSGPKKSIKNATGTVDNGGTINIANGHYFGENNTNVAICKNMTIVGQSRENTIINGTNSAQIFTIQKGLNVTIKNLTFVNGTATQNLTVADKNITSGGAICNFGNLTVLNSTFRGNTATSNDVSKEHAVGGGAIYNVGDLTVTGSDFINNAAKGNLIGNNGTWGGAICNFGNLTVYDSNFTGNNATAGGAIYNIGILAILNSIFTGNTAAGNVTAGGAIYNEYNSTLNLNGGILNISGSTFTGNIVSGSDVAAGGAIASERDLTIKNSTFKGNEAISTNDTAMGGAIFNFGNSTVINSKFGLDALTGNKASSTNTLAIGGAIYNIGNLTVNGSTFVYNSVTGNNITSGGAIGNSGNLTVSGSTFTGNIAVSANKFSAGGAIYNYGNLTVENKSTFTGNTATLGGAIFSDYGPSLVFVHVSNSSFTNNTANNGGAIWNGYTLTVNGSTFTGNVATAGGAIYNYGALAAANDIFTGNTAHTTDSSLAYEGGAILNEGNLTVTGSTFTGNFANLGGAISNRYNSAISGSNLIGNKADYDGGAIYSEYGTLIVHFSRITRNQLVGYGSQDITNYKGKVNEEYNWWGSNAGPSKGRIQYETDSAVTDTSVTNWMVLTLSASPTTVKARGTSILTANLCYDNHGVYHSPASGHVPDGMTVSFTTKFGTIGSKATTVNGIAKSTLKAGSTGGVVNVSAKTDSQTVQIPLKVISAYPKNYATGVSRTSTIYIKLSQNIKASTYWSKIYVKNLKTGKIVSISKSISGDTLYIKMSSKRYAYNWYQVYIPASAVKDYANHNLSTRYTFKFKTGR